MMKWVKILRFLSKLISFGLVEAGIKSFQNKNIRPQPFYVLFGQAHGNDEESKSLLKGNVDLISHETVQLLMDYILSISTLIM